MNANVDPDLTGCNPPSYVVTVSGGRQAELCRLPGGGVKIRLTAPAKDGTRRTHGSLDFRADRATEGLMAIGELCQRVDREGLPGDD